jgi:hypothetical protein
MGNPYAPYTDSGEVVANYLYTALLDNKSSFTYIGPDSTQYSVQDVWYGDESGLIPHLPCLCVVPGPEISQYNGVGGRPVMMTFQTFVMVYFGKITGDHQTNVHASLSLANAIKRFMNGDPTLGGQVIDSFCSGIDPGIAVRGGAMIDTSRMQFSTRSKVVLNP